MRWESFRCTLNSSVKECLTPSIMVWMCMMVLMEYLKKQILLNIILPADSASTDTIPNASFAFEVTNEIVAIGRSRPSSEWFKQPVIRTLAPCSGSIKKEIMH